MKDLGLWHGSKRTDETSCKLIMAPLSFVDDRSQPSLKRGSWVDGNCLTRVECIQESEFSNHALEQSRGWQTPIDYTKDRDLVLEARGRGIDGEKSCPSKSRRRVSFDCRVGIHDIPSVRNISDQERVDVWWTQNDYKLIRKMLKITLQMTAMWGKFHRTDEDFCSRGLDMHINGRYRQRKLQKQLAVGAVMNAQCFQRAEGFRDPEYIAEVYSQCCRPSLEIANDLAISDAEEVRDMDFD